MSFCDGSRCGWADCPTHAPRFIQQRERQSRRENIRRLAAGHDCDTHCQHYTHYMSSRTPSPDPTPSPPKSRPAAQPVVKSTRADSVKSSASSRSLTRQQSKTATSSSPQPQQAVTSPIPAGGSAQADNPTPRPAPKRSSSGLSRQSAQSGDSHTLLSSRRSSTSSEGSYHKLDGPWVGKQMVPVGTNKFQVTYERPAVKRKVVVVNPEQVAWMMQQMLAKVA